MTALEFLKYRKFIKINHYFKNTVTISLLVYLLYCLLNLFAQTKPTPLEFMVVFMFGVTFTLILGVIATGVRSLQHTRRYREHRAEVIRSAVKLARQKEDYSQLNKLLMYSKSYSYVFEVAYVICQHHKGEWLNYNLLKYPDSWGKDFWRLSSKFFEKEIYFEKDDLYDDLMNSTYLATVKKEVMEEVVKGCEDRGYYN